jgi:tetratricopeptide (TPR) repeat protein
MVRTVILWAGCLILAAACATTGRNGEKPKFGFEQLQRMAESYLAAGDTGLALQYLTMAEKMKPKDPTIQYDFGLAYGARGLPGESLARFEKALALNPDYAEASNALGVMYAEQNQFDKAEAAFKKALANPFYQTPHNAWYNLGRLNEKRGDPQAALQNYQQAVRARAANAPAYLRIGIIEEQLGDHAEAMLSYEKALQYNPNLIEALLHIGILRYQSGESADARDAFAQVVRLSPDSDFAVEAHRYLQMLAAGDGPR